MAERKRGHDGSDDGDATKRSKKTKEQCLWAELRQVQRKTRCTNKTLSCMFKAVQPFLTNRIKRSTFVLDKQFSKAGLQLHGCIGCNAYVFAPTNKRTTTCPHCGKNRFKDNKRPNEVCFILFIMSHYCSSLPSFMIACAHINQR